MNQARMHVGVDVGKDSLDICYPNGDKEHIRNTKRCRATLIKKARTLGAVISFEATGPYGEALESECVASGVPAVRLDAWKTRKYAESQGMLEKTDSIDSEMIRDYAASLRPDQLHFVRERSAGYRKLKRAVSVRRNLLKAKALIASQLEGDLDAEIKSAIARAVASIDRQVERMDAVCVAAIRSDERMGAIAALTAYGMMPPAARGRSGLQIGHEPAEVAGVVVAVRVDVHRGCPELLCAVDRRCPVVVGIGVGAGVTHPA